MSTLQQDFDALALLDSNGWTHNNHYHNFLLRYVPMNCRNALEIGSGTGAFARSLADRAEHVVAIDLSSEMIRAARTRSAQVGNIEFKVADAMSWPFPKGHFDCVVSIATLHHLDATELLPKIRASLTAGGRLIVLDLFEPEHNILKLAGLRDGLANVLAICLSGTLRLIHNGRLKPQPEVQAAWQAHGQHDSYPTMTDVRDLCAGILPDAKIKQHLLWRYSLIWQNP